jgi:hypothetical protein
MRLESNYARPPRGWLYGVLLTILVFWTSGVAWDAFRSHEITTVKFVGMVIMVMALALRAHEALTNDEYKTSRATLIARRSFHLGVIVFLLGGWL